MNIDYDKAFELMSERYKHFILALANRDDAAIVSDLCCSVIADDNEVLADEPMKLKFTNPVLGNDFCFMYKGYEFELSNCVAAGNRELSKCNILTDRYVCWMFSHTDDSGNTLEEHLKLNPDETKDSHSWAASVYLVNNGWSWGSEFDLKPGNVIDDIILRAIDKFLEENPEL